MRDPIVERDDQPRQDSRSASARTFYTQRTGGAGDGIWYMSRP